MIKISILLPYKENYTKTDAGAVSLFVKDTNDFSKHKNEISIFGNTGSTKNILSKNYININLDKKLFKSTSKLYVHSFLKLHSKERTDLIEVHNRPNYIRYIKDIFKKKIILYFHNDPLSMSGSKTIQDRFYLLNNLDKIIFNSNWSKNRFFIGLKNSDIFLSKTSVCFQSAPKTKINFSKKKKIISFIGKLNNAKGYDLFGEAIIKILDKHSEWRAKVIGDEPREKLFYEHKNLQILGFKANKYILNFLKTTSISVVCSRWDEPFGRASLEAASRGSAVIISNKGGLPETAKNAIILKDLTVNNLFNTMDKLITHPKRLLKIQKNNLSNFKFNHQYITNIIDLIRDEFVDKNINKKFYVNKKPLLKILHITNFNDRFNGRLHFNTGRRLNNGFIRLGHNVLSVSDRDILNKNKRLTDPKGIDYLQNTIIDSFSNFKPDLLILGHADAVSLKTLEFLKNTSNDLKICQWFLDPLSMYGPDYKNNTRRIKDKEKLMDATFLTTDPNSLSLNMNNSFFIPNPCDHSFETLENYNSDCKNDVFFAMSHGVHRGELKKGKYDDREIFINKLVKRNTRIKFDIYGMNNVQPIWGSNFINKISNSSMGLNLSRGKTIKYYSSDRIAQLVGNGLLTFIDEKTYLNDFFTKKEMVFYSSISDLSEKINRYKVDKFDRKKIAKAGKKKYFRFFNSTLVANYILSKTFGFENNEKFIWDKNF